MHFRFKNASFLIVLVLLVGFSCSEEAAPTIKTQISFDHTFNCVPSYSSENGDNVDLQHVLYIGDVPEVMALDEKITKIDIDSIKFSFAVPDEELYEVTVGAVWVCPSPLVSDDVCESPDLDPYGYGYFIEFYNGMEGFANFTTSKMAELEKSLLNHQLITFSAKFNFDSNNQGYPIESFDLTFTVYTTVHSRE